MEYQQYQQCQAAMMQRLSTSRPEPSWILLGITAMEYQQCQWYQQYQAPTRVPPETLVSWTRVGCVQQLPSSCMRQQAVLMRHQPLGRQRLGRQRLERQAREQRADWARREPHLPCRPR